MATEKQTEKQLKLENRYKKKNNSMDISRDKLARLIMRRCEHG